MRSTPLAVALVMLITGVDCEVTELSGVSHSVSNGTFKIGAFDQQFHSHGTLDGYQSLECAVSALGLEVDAQERGQVSP